MLFHRFSFLRNHKIVFIIVYSIEKVKVRVHILPPIGYEEYKEMKTVEIAAMVKSRIEAVIAEYEN